MTDDMTAALARTLRHHATEAPSTAGLTEKVMALASRRRRRRINASIAAIVVLAVGIPVTIVATTEGGGGTPPAVHQADPTWRWESYRGVQVQVPANWEYGVPGSAWCAALPEGETRPVRSGAVERPGYTFAILCGSEYPPVNQRENWLTFNSRNQVGERRFDDNWVEETRQVNGIFVTIFTNDNALRTAILGSAQPIVGADRHGCPSDHPIVADPDGYRPDSARGGLPPASAVESISVCRYVSPSGRNPNPIWSAPDSASPLLSSSRIAGEGAIELVDAILSAPEGEGPDVENADPGSDGSEIVVLRVDTVDGAREVVVRYSGESGNGFDDGMTKRELTADAIRPLLTGAHRPGRLFPPVDRLLQR